MRHSVLIRRSASLAVATALIAGACAASDPSSAPDTTAPTESSNAAPTDPATTDPPPTDPATTSAPSTTTSSTTTSTTTTSTSATSAPPPTTPEPTAEVIRAAIESDLASESGAARLIDRMAELGVPGVSIAIVRDGAVIDSFGVGTTASGEPMTASTISQVGSVSKPVAAIGAASMAADGSLDWDADVTGLLVSFELPPGEQSADNPVTVNNLLSHTAGTSVDGFVGYPADSVPDLPTVLAGGGDTEPVTVVQAPGSGFSYSGGGYELVEQTMIDVDGAATFDELMTPRVLDVAGMIDSGYQLELTDEQLTRATGGSINGDALEQLYQRHPENAAAGLWTTADDLGALLVAFNNSLSGADESLLPQAWARRLVTPAVDILDPTGDLVAMGQGFFLDDLDDPAVYRHNGRNVGYAAEIAGTTDGRFGIVVITNGFPGGTPLAREIITTAAAEMGWDA